MSDHIPNYKPPRLHGRTPYQNYLCRTVMHRPERSIFCGGGVNVTYNIKTPGIWSYVGMGIGQAIGSLFGGGFGGCFGSGFGGLFGGGFGGCFGGGFPMMNFWNNPSLSWNNCNPLNWFKSKNSDGKGGADGKCEDPDLEKFNELDKEERALEDKSTRTAAEIESLRKRVKAAKQACDDNHKAENNDSYDNLLERIKNLKPTTASKPAQVNLDNKPTAQADDPANAPTNQTVQEKPTTKAQAAPKAEVDLKDKDINSIKVEEIEDINDPSVAIAILKKADRINESDSSNIKVKVPRNYKELLLAQKSGLSIQFCKNPRMTGAKQDKFIEYYANNKYNKTLKITKQPDGSYNVTAQDKCGEYVLNYAFDNDGNAKIVKLISAKNSGIIGEYGKVYQLNNMSDNVEYNINDNDDYATRPSATGAMNNNNSNNAQKKTKTK